MLTVVESSFAAYEWAALRELGQWGDVCLGIFAHSWVCRYFSQHEARHPISLMQIFINCCLKSQSLTASQYCSTWRVILGASRGKSGLTTINPVLSLSYLSLRTLQSVFKLPTLLPQDLCLFRPCKNIKETLASHGQGSDTLMNQFNWCLWSVSVTITWTIRN